jgi:O-antigen ligase
MFDVKPHNWYLQQWVENGLLATLCLIGFYLWYMVESIRIYRRVSLKTDMNRVGFAIFIGTLIYMISGLANDSTVNVAPVYWVMMGLGISVNHIVKEREFPAEPAEAAEPVLTEQSAPTGAAPAAKTSGKKKQSRKQRKQR